MARPALLLLLSIVSVPVGAPAQDAAGARPARSRMPRVHDPSTIVRDGDVYRLFHTGTGVPSLMSGDLLRWSAGPPVLAVKPEWVEAVVTGHRGHYWAPDVLVHDGRYRVYYSVSAFGKNTSAIGLAESSSLDPGEDGFHWTDRGVVIQSAADDDFNAIDPAVVVDRESRHWMTFGSFWSGIKLVELSPVTGLRVSADSPLHALAWKEQIEAPALIEHGGYWYLFVNWGWCCRGVNSTYSLHVGRSRALTGPYLDKNGVDMLQGGGSELLSTEGRMIGPGHPGVFAENDQYWLSYHFYDREENGRSRLAVRPLAWDGEGWPKIAGPPISPEF